MQSPRLAVLSCETNVEVKAPDGRLARSRSLVSFSRIEISSFCRAFWRERPTPLKNAVSILIFGRSTLISPDSIGIQNILHLHNYLKFVNIRPMDDRQDLEVIFAHPFENNVKRLIGVDMRKMVRYEETCQLLVFL